MSTQAPKSFATTRVLVGLGFLTSAAAWFLIAPPVITFTATVRHAGHFGTVYLHVLGGTIMLFLGLANLYIGTTRRRFNYHKILGRTYLIGGAIGAIAAILITTSRAHTTNPTAGVSNNTVSLVTLAVAWLLSAGMAYRAVRNRRFDSHREWMIRSYVLAWTFVFCRIASRVPGVEELGGGNAFIWLSWVGPLVVAEVALQWERGADKSTKAVALRDAA